MLSLVYQNWIIFEIVSPGQNSFLPMFITTLSSVIPWDLCIVTALISRNGNWRQEQYLPEDDQDLWIDEMGTVLMVEPVLYSMNCSHSTINQTHVNP